MRLAAFALAVLLTVLAYRAAPGLASLSVFLAFVCGMVVAGSGRSAASDVTAVSVRAQVAQLDPAVAARVKAIAQDGHKIEAIKELREATGMGLKDAKDAVEAILDGAPIRRPE